jgi:hypothetical protein
MCATNVITAFGRSSHGNGELPRLAAGIDQGSFLYRPVASQQ